jgi:hypothetical protein
MRSIVRFRGGSDNQPTGGIPDTKGDEVSLTKFRSWTEDEKGITGVQGSVRPL